MTIAFDQDTKRRAERNRIEKFFIDKPYEFCRKIYAGETLKDVEVKPTFGLEKLAEKAQRLFPIRGCQRERGARGEVSCCQDRGRKGESR